MTSSHLQRSVHAGGSSSCSPRLLRPPPYHAAHPLPRHFLVRPATTKHTASGTITMPGPMVPLVAVDQLPEWIDLAGVPRELTVEQTMGLQNLGSVAPEVVEQQYYEVRLHQDVRFDTSSASTPSATPTPKRRSGGETRDGSKNSSAKTASSLFVDSLDTDLLGNINNSKHTQKKHGDVVTVVDRASERRGSHMSYIDDSTSSAMNSSSDTASYSSSCTETPPSNTRGKKTTTANKGKEKVSKTETASSNSKPGRGSTATIALNPRLPTPPPPTVPINPYPLLRHVRHVRGEPAPPAHHPASRLLSAIVHCRHWCHHGSCKYGPDCRYEHDMPRTHEGLREVGLADLPNWYKAALEMAHDMQQKQKNNNNSRRNTNNKVHEKRAASLAAAEDLMMTAMVMGESGSGSGGVGVGVGGNASGGGGGGSRRKVSSSSVVVANDVASPSTVAHATNSEKIIIREERLGRLASVESGDESDESHSGGSAEHEGREMEVQQAPANKKQVLVEDITTPVEKLVDI